MNNKAHLRPKDYDSNGDIIPMSMKEEKGDLISREALKKALHSFFDGKVIDEPAYILRDVFCLIDGAPTVEDHSVEIAKKSVELGRRVGRAEEAIESRRPQGKWYDFIPNCLKARHGEYVLYKVDFLLDNLAREVNIMESARRMKGGAE